MKTTVRGLLLLGALALVACDGNVDELNRGNNGNAAKDAGAEGVTPATCETRGGSHMGFGKTDLTSDRVQALQGADRGRIKPYSALKTEVKRVTGQSPGSLDAASATYGTPQDRWFNEPIASALTVSTTYNVAFEACLGVTKDAPEYGAQPSAETASKVCSTLERKFWSRTPGPEEIDACVQTAVTDSTAEPDARRRWAYACAAVLSSSGFMSY